jgi:hypothetical protein
VRTVGLLVLAIAAALGVAAARDRGHEVEVVVLAAAGALAFAAVDLWYGLSGRIASVYLVDGAGEVGILLALLMTRRRGEEPSGSRGPADSETPRAD